MPYISQKDRISICAGAQGEYIAISRQEIGELVGEAMRNGGDLQYMLAVAIQEYLSTKGLCYQHCQDIMGALTGANAEFIRCVVSPYEDKKILENGAVYDTNKMKSKGY